MKKKSKEKSLIFSQIKKIQLLKNIYVNLKCIKSKDNIQINKNNKKEKLSPYSHKTYKIKKEKKEKDGKNMLKNKYNKQKSKTKKNFYSNSNNNSIKKYNSFYKKRNIKNEIKSISHTQSTINNISSYINKNKNNNRNKKARRNQNNLLISESNIIQNNPLELTFGSSSFKSNIKTETNEIELEKNNNNININMNKSLFVTINNKKIIKDKKNIIKHNKITRLKKKLFFDPHWKIGQKYNHPQNKKNEIIIQNYNAKNKYDFINNHYTNININYREKNYHSVNISNELRKNNKKIKIKNEKIISNKSNVLKNKILKNRNEKEKIFKNYTTKNSAIHEKNTLKKIKSSNSKEYVIKININDKGNGRYKLIIQRTKNYIRRMPKSAPKLFLAHPSLKNLFL